MSIDTTHDTRITTDVPDAVHTQIAPYQPASYVAPHTVTGTVIPSHHPAAVYQPHPAYQPLPLHVAALIDHHHLPRPIHPHLDTIRHYHLWPSIGACALSALGWWAHTQPEHIPLMIPFLAVGVGGPLAAVFGHHAHGSDADTHLTRGFLAAGAVGFSGAAAVGAGFSGISALATAILATAGTLGSMGWRQHRRQADRDYIVDVTTAHASTPMPPTPDSAPLLPGGFVSDEAHRLHQAFAAMGVNPITIDTIRRTSPDSWSTFVYLPESKTMSPKMLGARLDSLRNNLRCRSVSITPTAIGNRIQISVQDGDSSPLAETIGWPGPTTDDITKPISIGVLENGEPIGFKLAGRHTLYAGITEGGKSGGVNVAACSIAAMRNAVMVLIDLKPGQLELGPYESVAYRSAAGIDDASLLMQALIAAMDERGQQLKEEREATGRPVREWDPNTHGPAVVVLIDELAEALRLDPKVFELWLRIMQVGRALGIWIIGATQAPSAKALGGTTDASGQFTNIACFRTKSSTQTNIILGPGAHGDGWRTDETTLPLKGMLLPRTPEYAQPQVGRGYWIDPDQVMSVIAQYQDQRPDLDERTAAAMEAVLGDRCDPRRPSPPPRGVRDALDVAEDFHADVHRLRLVPTYPDHTPVEEKQQGAWEAFRRMGSATVMDLLALQLPGMGSREPCMTALRTFEAHGGTTATRDADGRSTRYTCTVPLKREASA